MKSSVSALILYTENTYMHTNLYDIVSQKTGNLHQYCCENVRSCIVPLLGVCCVLHLQIQVPSNQSQAVERPVYQYTQQHIPAEGIFVRISVTILNCAC